MNQSRGFTLVELLVVIAILAVLTTFVATRYINRIEDARRQSAKNQIRAFMEAIKLYKLDSGTVPETEQGLEALVEEPTQGTLPRNWREGGYLESPRIPKDPWGNDYIYVTDEPEGYEYSILSYGADGIDGGEDADADIESWNLDELEELEE